MTLDTILWAICSLSEAAIIVLISYRRFWRIFPLFFAYSIWSLVGNAASVVVLHWYSTSSPVYATAYLINLLIDSTLLFAVLVELALSAIRPLRGAPSRTAIFVVVLLIIAAGAIIWPFTTFPDIQRLSLQLAILVRLKQAVSALAVLIFLVLAAGSQMLAIGWRNRELQIATGLGLYSLAGIIVTVLHTYPNMRDQYGLLEEFLMGASFLTLLYWIVSFVQREQERREMSPQMQNMLLAVAGVAKSTRVSLTGSHVQSGKDKEEH